MSRLTDRQAAEWFIKPALERAQRMKDAARGLGGGGGTDLGSLRGMTDEQAWDLMKKLGVQGLPPRPPRRKT